VEWFSRGLRQNEHFLEVASEPLDAICPAVDAALAAAERGFAAGASCDVRTEVGSSWACPFQGLCPTLTPHSPCGTRVWWVLLGCYGSQRANRVQGSRFRV